MSNVKGFLISVSDTVKTNTNGTEFRSCIVAIEGNNYFAKIWEKSVSKAVVGNEYTVEMLVDGDNLWLTLLTGVTATIATPNMLAHLLI